MKWHVPLHLLRSLPLFLSTPLVGVRRRAGQASMHECSELAEPAYPRCSFCGVPARSTALGCAMSSPRLPWGEAPTSEGVPNN